MDDPVEREHADWIRMHCLRLARATTPSAPIEKIIETAMTYEGYVRGECYAETVH